MPSSVTGGSAGYLYQICCLKKTAVW